MISTITELSSSPYTHLKPVSLDVIRLHNGFWADWQKTLVEITLPTQYTLLENTGRLENFRRVVNHGESPFQGYYFNDSDVYKWLEAACWAQVISQDEAIRNSIEEIISLITAAQDDDGYISTYFSLANKKQRWKNLRDMHELYCAGHLIQAAIAHSRVTGKDNFLDSAVNLADHICRQFLYSDKPGTPGHPEIEMALVELFRTTGEEKYLEMAVSFLDQRGFGLVGGREYHLDRVPFRELERLEGHAVRALYLCGGATDIYLETGEESLWETLDRLWKRMVSRQLYITGGIGSRHAGESYGDDFELPNARAYAETCAAIASFMWNWRMLQCTADVRYADLMEWTLYNAILPGISITGEKYNYVNPLRSNGTHLRQLWFDCACCPTNIVRVLAGLGAYFYSHFRNAIWIHQYTSNVAEFPLDNGLEIRLSINTEYPWDGHVEIELLPSTNHATTNEEVVSRYPQHFGLNLRIPAWVKEKVPVYIDGIIWNEIGNPGSYLNIHREWTIGNKIVYDLPMQVRFLESHPFVMENSNRVAMSRGPLLYCAEAYDNPNVDPREIILSPDSDHYIKPITNYSKEVIGLHLDAGLTNISEIWADRLYQDSNPHAFITPSEREELIALPYYAWGNRENGWMQIWFRQNMAS